MKFESLGPSESQLKRSAELASIVSSTVPSEGGAGGGGYSLGSMPKRDSSRSETTDGDDGHGEGHEVNRYPVAQVEFSRVETPFVIGVWILSASIAKIGKCTSAAAIDIPMSSFYCEWRRPVVQLDTRVYENRLLPDYIKRFIFQFHIEGGKYKHLNLFVY